MVDSKLRFASNVNTIAAKELARSNLMLKGFVSRDRTTLYRAFTTYVRPIFKDACCVWSLCRIIDITRATRQWVPYK